VGKRPLCALLLMLVAAVTPALPSSGQAAFEKVGSIAGAWEAAAPGGKTLGALYALHRDALRAGARL